MLQLLDPAAVATMLDCTEATVEDRLRDGTLPGLKLGRGWRIPADALADRLRELALAEASKRRELQPRSTPDPITVTDVVRDANGMKRLVPRRVTPPELL